jgi:branched-chain amino acid transport system ATP-binding protein
MLAVEGARSAYGRVQALSGVDLEVGEGELVAVIGANGAGKTTLLRAVSGVQPLTGGRVRLDGRDLAGVPAGTRVRLGIAHAPEGRQVWDDLTVEDNLLLGGSARPAGERSAALARVRDLYPSLLERRRQRAGALSAGDQQALAIGRALMARPRLLLLDEPGSAGLAPRVLARLRADGVAVLLAEQNARAALDVADRAYLLEGGRVALSGTARELEADPRVREAHLSL